MRARTALPLIAVVLLAVPATGQAAPNWVSPAANISAAGGGLPTPQVASNARGDTAVVWLDPVSSTVFASERPVGGSFTVGSAVSAAPDQVLGNVEIDAAGNIYVFFITSQMTPAASRPNVAVKPIGGSSWTVTPLATANSQDPPQAPVLGAVAPDGKAVAVWFQGHTNNATLSNFQSATKPAGSTTWSAKAMIPGSTGNAPSFPSLAINAAGQAAFAYARQFCSGALGRAVAATMSAAGTWTTLNAMDTCSGGGAGLVGGPVVDIDAAGTATGAWTRNDGTNNIVQFSTKTIGAPSFPTTPASPTANDLSAAGADAGAPAIAVAPDATTTVAWTRGNVVQERTRPALGGAFGAATNVPNTLSSSSPPVLGVAGDGSLVTLWSGLDGSSKSVIGAARRASGAAAFTALPSLPGTDNSLPAVALDGEGNAPAAWLHMSAGPQYTLQASGLDAAGPSISAVSFPATAAAGESFAYGATLADRWSAPTGSWAFGDGTTGPLSGNKTYAAGGSFAATLTATDGAGNPTSETRTISVSGGAATLTPISAGGDTTAPVLTAVGLTNSTFAVDTKGAAERTVTAKNAKKGTTFRFTLSEAARVLFKIEQKAQGRRVGTTCRKPAPSNRRRKACTRLVTIGTFGQSAASGSNTKKFSGRLGRKTLKPGSYRASLVARDAAGNASAVKRLNFRVVRR